MGLPSPSGTTAARLLKALAAAIAAGAALILAFVRGGAAAPGDPRLVLVGTFTSPVYVAAPRQDPDRLFVVEQAGRIMVVRSGAQLGSPFLDIRSLVSTGGERGLLSLAFPPDYASSGRFYVYYTARDPAGAITIAEYRTSSGGDRADANTRRTVLSIPHPRSNHNGGQLQFGPDGYLYIGTGDGGGGGDPDRAGQRLDTLLGKLLRIDPRAGPAGEPCWEGRHPYEPNLDNPECRPLPANHTRPVFEYPHARGCSITGGYVVRDPGLSALIGRYVYGDYCERPLWSVRLAAPDAADDRRLGFEIPSLSSFGEDACGRVYVVSASGPVYLLEASGQTAPTSCQTIRPPVRCRVPRVVGLRLAAARVRIRRANCRVGRVRYRRSPRARGRVLAQSPRPGARRPRGTRVQLTIGRGRRP